MGQDLTRKQKPLKNLKQKGFDVGIDSTRDGRAQRPARGQRGIQRLQRQEANTAAEQMGGGGGCRAQGYCHQAQAGTLWPCRATTRAREAVQPQGGREEKDLFLHSFPKCLPILQPWKSNPWGSYPSDSEQGRKRTRKTPRITAGRGIALNLQRYSHSVVCGLSMTQHTSILQAKVNVSSSKALATGLCSDGTDVTLSSNSLFH